MVTLTLHNREGVPTQPAQQGAAADALLWEMGVRAGHWVLRPHGVSSAPQLTYARELYALQDHVGSVLTDRVRQRPGAQGGDPRDHHRLAWPDQRHEHTHGAPEVRVLLSGQARYVLRAPVLDGWAVLVCEPGDWLALPAGLPHTFEASPTQGVDLLRLHVQAGAWEAERTAALLPQALVRWREAAPDEGLALAA